MKQGEKPQGNHSRYNIVKENHKKHFNLFPTTNSHKLRQAVRDEIMHVLYFVITFTLKILIVNEDSLH